jgi:hypothetical protein
MPPHLPQNLYRLDALKKLQDFKYHITLRDFNFNDHFEITSDNEPCIYCFYCWNLEIIITNFKYILDYKTIYSDVISRFRFLTLLSNFFNTIYPKSSVSILHLGPRTFFLHPFPAHSKLLRPIQSYSLNYKLIINAVGTCSLYLLLIHKKDFRYGDSCLKIFQVSISVTLCFVTTLVLGY